MSIETQPDTGLERPLHPNTWVYLDGQFRRYHDIRIGLMTHALHYGTGTFEGIRAYWTEADRQLRLLAPAAHFDRLRRSAQVLKMKLPHSTEELVAITLELLRSNEFETDTYVRPLVFISSEVIGVKLNGLQQSFAIYCAPMGKYVSADDSGGSRVMVSSWRRISDGAMPARAKITGSYVNSALAKTEALENGFDEAIVLTEDGHVSEGSAENIFLVREGAFVTPPVTDDILEGITRRFVIQLVRDELGLAVQERSIDRSELYCCDELFLCGTGAEITPVVEVDRRPVGDGRIGELTQEIQSLYNGIVRGQNPKYANLTLPVY